MKIFKNSLIIFSFCFLPLLFSCSQSKLEKKVFTLERSDGTTVYIKVEIAKTPDERNFGFMERKKIPEGTGMLFIFEKDQILSFWMKNTPLPLSIAYIDTNGIIKDIFHMTPYSLATIKSTSSVRYALEVPQNWFEKVNIKVGDKLIL
ncbi:MAG: DUF192 domain-containing protein [Treponema sp.]|nr:DUF192 domain-containing protein [Treponema sp.]